MRPWAAHLPRATHTILKIRSEYVRYEPKYGPTRPSHTNTYEPEIARNTTCEPDILISWVTLHLTTLLPLCAWSASQQGIRSLKQYSVELEGAVQVSRNEVAGLKRGVEAAGREVVNLRAAKALSEGGLRQQVRQERVHPHAARLVLASRDQICSLILGYCSVARLSFDTATPADPLRWTA